MPGTVRTARIVLTSAAATLWATGAIAAVIWAAGIETRISPRLLSVDLAAASTCTVCAVMCWLTAVRLGEVEKLLIRTLGDVTRRAATAVTTPLRRIQ